MVSLEFVQASEKKGWNVQKHLGGTSYNYLGRSQRRFQRQMSECTGYLRRLKYSPEEHQPFRGLFHQNPLCARSARVYYWNLELPRRG